MQGKSKKVSLHASCDKCSQMSNKSHLCVICAAHICVPKHIQDAMEP